MKCTDLQSKIFDYIDCELDKDNKSLVAQHLLACPNCRTQYDSWQALIKDIQDTKYELYKSSEINFSIKDNVMSHIEKLETERRKYKTNIRKWNKLMAVAASFAIMFSGASIYSNLDFQTDTDTYSQAEIMPVKKQDMVTISSADPIIVNEAKEESNNIMVYSLSALALITTAGLYARNRQDKKKLDELYDN